VSVLAAVLGALALAQGAGDRFLGFWGSQYSPITRPDDIPPAGRSLLVQPRSEAPDALSLAARERRKRPAPVDSRSRVVHWNNIAIDASGVDHTPVAPGENRIFGEQLGPGRAARALAIVHIAIFDAVNAIADRWESYTAVKPADPGASIDAAIAQAAHDTLTSLFPSQAASFASALQEELARIPQFGKDAGRHVGSAAAAAILADRQDDGSATPEPRVGIEFIPSTEPGKWRQDPISRIPIALGAFWGDVRPFVLKSSDQFRVKPPPKLHTKAYARAFDEVARLGGDGTPNSPTERTDDQTSIGIYWAYDGMPSLCAPPRLYNQIARTIADQMGSDFYDVTRLLALVNTAMADAGIAIWESKYFYEYWRPVTGIREADEGTGPSGAGDGNPDTAGKPTFSPLGAPASNLSGPDFTPPFPAYPSGHAGFGGAIFEVLREFYGTDDIPFMFTSDEYNGITIGHDGQPRPLHPRSFTSLSQAEEENGQSRIYLGIHWSFDKTEGISQGRKVANYVLKHAFRAR
jgi:hypothetical protein